VRFCGKRVTVTVLKHAVQHVKNTLNKYALLFLGNYKQEIILSIIKYCTVTCNKF